MQSSLVSYSNNRVIRWVWNNANLIYLISGFSVLHLQTDNQLAKHCIVLCRLVVRVHCKPHCTKQHSVVQCRVFSPQNMHFPIVWCVVYIHFAACSLTTNLQSTILLNYFVWPGMLISCYDNVKYQAPL